MVAESPVRIHRAATAADLERVHRLRLSVFVHEQGVPLGEELDDRDHEPGAVHLLAVADDLVLGTARVLVEEPGCVHVTRVAVAEHGRRRGVGRALMSAAEEIALREHAVDGRVEVQLSAQESAIGFYRRLGYTIGTARYLDAGIQHADATKVLVTSSARDDDSPAGRTISTPEVSD